MQSRKWAGTVSLILIAAGLGISLYLFARGNKLSQGAAGSDFCSAVFDKSCDATLTSEYSHVAGLSVAGWGAVYFALLGALVFSGMTMRAIFLRAALAGALLVNLIGLAVSGYLAWLIVSGKVPVCPLCLATHAINVLLFGALILYRGESPTGFLKDAGAGLTYVFAPGQRSTPEHTTRLLAFIAIGLFSAAVYEGLALRSRPAAPALTTMTPSQPTTNPAQVNAIAQQIVNNVIQAYNDQEPVDIPIGPNDPRIGPVDAPAQLVVFSDFECNSCKNNSKVLEQLVQIYGNKISIVVKNYPLSSTCNRNINKDQHKYACGAAYAAAAANMQGKYWPFHDLVYRLRGAPTPNLLIDAAQRVGLDIGKFTTDMASDAAKAKVEEDVELAIKLKLYQTPTIYLNGRMVSADALSGAQLPFLIGNILNQPAPFDAATAPKQP